MNVKKICFFYTREDVEMVMIHSILFQLNIIRILLVLAGRITENPKYEKCGCDDVM